MSKSRQYLINTDPKAQMRPRKMGDVEESGSSLFRSQNSAAEGVRREEERRREKARREVRRRREKARREVRE